MIQENKELLLKDLCARLSYKIIVKVNDTQGIMDEIDIPNERIFVSNLNPFLYGGARASWFTVNGDKIYPYLRPMSSMTEEEKKELERIIDEKLNKHIGQEDDEWTPWVLYDTTGIKNYVGGERFYFDEMSFIYDWLNAHHFDYRGLIEKGLAIEALEGMYNV